MNFRFSAEDKAFRAEVRGFLEAHWRGGTGDSTVHDRSEFEAERTLTRQLGKRGWLTMAWPAAHGGADATHLRQAILKEECAYFEVTGLGAPGGQGAAMVGPAIIVHGTDDQKQRFLPPIARGETYWCQGFSEPGAGSDLASVQTKATRDGDNYVINGHKTWTSGAEYADWIHLLARTDQDAPKHKGISYFLIDMRTPGITWTPVGQMTGHSGFYETFFDNVVVPRENMIGEENRGWYVATTALNLERSGVHRIGALRRWMEYTKEGLRERGPIDEDARLALADHAVEIEVGRWLAYRVAWMADRGETPAHEASVSKVYGTELSQRFAATAINLLGLPGALTYDSYRAPAQGRANYWYLMTVHYSISAGTSEIQRNIIAGRGLGLPRGN